MSELVIEYLIHFDSRTSLPNNEESFKKSLAINTELSFKKDKIDYKEIVVGCNIKLNRKEKERFFSLKIIYKEEDIELHPTSCLELISELNRAIYYSGKVEVYTLWDDFSFNYSKQAYPLIYEVENLMRKLATKFMVVNFGAQWTKTELPDYIIQLAKSRTNDRANDNKNKADILYRLDFIHLVADFLLKPIKQKNCDEDFARIHQKIIKADALNELNLNELKKLVPQSNWQKYFSSLIQYDSNKLEKNWSRLYELRCQVAHNNFLNPSEYKEILELTKDLKVKLQDAIEKVDGLEVPEKDKEEMLRTTLIVFEPGAGKSSTLPYLLELYKYKHSELSADIEEIVRREDSLVDVLKALEERINLEKETLGLTMEVDDMIDDLIDETEDIEDTYVDEKGEQ